jgi:hypothetical protein
MAAKVGSFERESLLGGNKEFASAVEIYSSTYCRPLLEVSENLEIVSRSHKEILPNKIHES